MRLTWRFLSFNLLFLLAAWGVFAALPSDWQKGWLLLVLLAVSLSLSTCLAGRRIISSLKHLNQAAEKAAAGSFVTSIPVASRDEAGRLARNMEAMTENLRRQVARIETEKNFLTTVLTSMSEGVLVTDRKGRVTQVNPAFSEIFDLRLDPVGRMPLEIIRNPEIQKGITTVLSRQSNREESEIQIGGKILRVHFSAIRGEEKIEGVVTVLHDITQLRRLELIRKEFVSNVSHELKTPLTSIRGFAETLAEDLPVESDHRIFAHKIYRNACQLSEMIEDLLNLTRLEHAEVPLKGRSIHFEKLMKELEVEFSPILKAKRIAFKYCCPPGHDTFFAGEAYVRRVFHNLVDNALKYTESGEVRIQMEVQDQELLFSVADTGVGIPSEDLSRIFERFYRVHKDRARQSGGSGIGLAIVKQIVLLHGGRVWAESDLDKGTTIFFTWPQ